MSDEIKETNDTPQEKGSSFSLGDEILEWAESFVFAIFIVILVFTFIFRVVQVDGSSMEDTLNDHDRLILTHFNYTPERGDIVVINSKGLNETIIKRVIAVEGDTISIDFDSGDVTLNGEVLQEDYIKEKTRLYEGREIQDMKIGKGEVFVMGDNRMHSSDSRSPQVGVISIDDILGKAIFRIYPLNKAGSVS